MHYGNGWTHSDVYTMPVYLRRFYLDLLNDAKKHENDQIKKRNESIRQRARSNKGVHKR